MRLQMRETLLEVYEALIDARQSMLDFGTKHSDALIPAYTGGVQAQPVSMGHFITGYLEVLGRHADNFEQAFQTLNLSPHGAAALGTSSYPLNRHRLSDLLGFDRSIRNSYDAVLLATVEAQMRLGGVATGTALTVTQLMQDLGRQYYLARPWLTFPAHLTGGSTIMPQKLNPNGINNARANAAGVIGEMVSFLFAVHKEESGSFASGDAAINAALSQTAVTLRGVNSMFDAFEFHEDRALEQVLDDYATATELANTLQRVGNIPFRDAHHVAAGVVNFGRDNGLRASAISFDDFTRVFGEVAERYNMTQTTSGLSADDFRRALSPENMVRNAKGFGGPQVDEVRAMLDENRASIDADRAWLAQTRERLHAAARRLDEVFSGL